MNAIIAAVVLNIDVIVLKTFGYFGTRFIYKVFLEISRRILMIFNSSIFSNINPLTKQVCINVLHSILPSYKLRHGSAL